MVMTNRLPLLLLFLLCSAGMMAGPKPGTDPGTLIGKRMFESPLTEWLEQYDYRGAKEDFQVDGPVLFLKHYKKGYLLMFDINMVLNSMSFYNQGGSYERFTGVLPMNLKFGMDRDSLYRQVKLNLEESDNNPYILTRQYPNYRIELLFSSSKLNQINILAPDSLRQPSDMNFVRLLAIGTKVSGDCDTLTGRMSYDSGKAYYEGGWKYGLPHGKGYFRDQFNNEYTGDFKFGYFWGNGSLNVHDMYRYQGEFLMSRRHGVGTCRFVAPKGEMYEGKWKADEMSGLGKYSKGSRFYYYGNMAHSMFNGNGKIVTPEGWLEGNFVDGVPNGMFKQYLKKENVTIEGEYVNGKRQGKFKVTDQDKKVTFKEFKDDIEIIGKD